MNKHTLFALCGTSPAVITETIWALAMEQSAAPESAELPHRVVILTTTTGKSKIIQDLLTATEQGPSVWTQLRNSLASKGYPVEGRLVFGDTSENLRTFSREDLETGHATSLDDIRDRSDQDTAADFMLESLRSITETPDEELTVSLAGGRKTMSALLYGCMTLIGREHDRLTHVLVPSPYDNPTLSPRFYFPAQLEQTLTQLNAETVAASSCEIELADIPFVPLRYAFEKHLSTNPGSFRSLVSTYATQSIHKDSLPSVTIHTAEGSLEVGSTEVKLSADHLALCFFFLSRAKQEKEHYTDYKSSLDDLNYEISELKKSAPKGNLAHWTHKLTSTSIDDERLRKQISAIRKKLERAGPAPNKFSERFIQRGQCGVDYPPEKIIFI